MDNKQGIDWPRIGRDDFERFVEAVLVRKYEDVPDLEATAVDGRGGDGGIDVDVRAGEKTVHVYQLKYFPEGFSSGWGKTRRGQIQKSFTAALTVETLRDWTLVVPSNLTPGERRWVGALRGKHDIRVHMMGRAELDVMFAKFEEIRAWATRDPLLEALRAAGHEAAALAGPDDLANRAHHLMALADSRDPDWGVRVEMSNGLVSQSFYPKHPDAATRSPVTLQFMTRFDERHSVLRGELQHAMDWGTTRPVILSPEVISGVSLHGPDWMTQSSDTAQVEIHPPSLTKPVPTEMRILSPSGASLLSIHGTIDVVDAGHLGITFEAAFRNCLTMRFRVPKNTATHGGSVDIAYNIAGVPASDGAEVLRFLRGFAGGDRLQLLANDISVFVIEPPERSDGNVHEIVDDEFFLLVDDLAYVQRELNVSFRVPEKLSKRQAVDIRFARLLLEGRCAMLPGYSGFHATMSGEAIDEVRTMLTSIPTGYSISDPEWGIEILGHRLAMGTLRTFHPSVTIPGAAEHIAALEAGKAAGRRVDFVPTDGSGIRAWLEDRWTDENKPIVAEPWGIPGVPESEGVGK